jgi:hypothetical protein
VTDAFPVGVNTQVFVLFPPLEHAPDQMASRPFETVSVIAVPAVNVADPVLPTATLMPAGFEVIRSPLRPVAATVKVSASPAGVTFRVAVRVTAPALAVMVAGVVVETALVVAVKVTLVAPCATVTLGGTVAAPTLLESATANPPEGAAAVKLTVPCDAVPPTTLAGFTAIAESEAGAGGGAGGVTPSVAVRVVPP